MNKRIVSIGIIFTLLLTGCVNSTSSESISSESVFESAAQTTQLIGETKNSTTTDVTAEETSETEEWFYGHTPIQLLMYNNEIYSFIVGSSQVEIDGKYYELDGEEVFIDAERMKNECEYIGESISVTDDYIPTRELELTFANSNMPCQLYKIDENQILVYSNEEFEIPERYSEWAIVYPGTYHIHLILLKSDKSEELEFELVKKYYRYAERFPEHYAQETENEQNSAAAE
ncbi:MAG: hypothetical protein K2O14_04795 [Oscillospiraceae bacterium]|nr:hypothetical protein [Oscillospiraceae bacterium]